MPSGICNDVEYLYVVFGGKIMQYTLTDRQLVKSVDLPKPPAPPAASDVTADAGQLPPHPPMGHSGICTDDRNLYILAGPQILIYTVPGLDYQTAVDLPKPSDSSTAQ